MKTKPMTAFERIQNLLSYLYGEARAERVWADLARRLAGFRAHNPHLAQAEIALTQWDAILITYGDQFQASGVPPLQVLSRFLDDHLGEAVSGVHILPFYPYSSDDGFSVIDYHEVDASLGGWEDVRRLGEHYRLMLDAVINHISRESAWFQGYIRGEAPYTDYFITVDPDTDLSLVFRPRDLPLLTAVDTSEGVRSVWTTFSEDQIDLNYANPQVLLEIIDVLLEYVEKGAEIIRLDAIAYLWKEIGTTCIHLPQTHAVVRLWRALLDAVAPGVLLITETNVPHEENISYFGEYLPELGRTDEAQLVYNFPLAPLVLHSFLKGKAIALSEWARTLETPRGGAFFNFIASHDGIGVMPARGLLSEAEVEALVERTRDHGGRVSYKRNADGSQSVYELNITLYDFLNDPGQPDLEKDVRRFLASQAILLSLAGVPGIYVHSLFGSRNCHVCYEETGRARSLNREKFDVEALEAVLAAAQSHQRRVFEGYVRMLQIRREYAAFHPEAGQMVLDLDDAVFALARRPVEGEDVVVCLVNVAGEGKRVELIPATVGVPISATWLDLIGEITHRPAGDTLRLELAPYQTVWLTPVTERKPPPA